MQSNISYKRRLYLPKQVKAKYSLWEIESSNNKSTDALIGYEKLQKKKVIVGHVPNVLTTKLFGSLKDKTIKIKHYDTGESIKAWDSAELVRLYINSMSVRNGRNIYSKLWNHNFKFVYILGFILLYLSRLLTDVFLASKISMIQVKA